MRHVLVEHAAGMGNVKSEYKNLARNPERKGRPTCRREDNNEIDYGTIGRQVVIVWINLDQEKDN
jgi:hypothetical protein